MAFLSKDRMPSKNLTLPLWSLSFRYMQAPHTNAYLHGDVFIMIAYAVKYLTNDLFVQHE
jgi:hypothetical protein